MDLKRGIITIAQGKKEYIEMAINLGRSLNRKSPNITLALVTDSNDKRLKRYYHYIIPIDISYGVGFIQKLHIYEYSIFEETLFIDADSLVVNRIDFIFDLFQSQDVSAFGNKRTSGKWSGIDIPIMLKQLSIPYIIALNGGVYFFKRNEVAKNVFDESIQLLEDYDKFGIERLRGNFNEEPLISLAMSIFGMAPVDDKGKGMRTPIGQSGQFKMDILKGYCEFYKHNELVSPVIMHFGGDCTKTFFYKREVLKLKLATNNELLNVIISFLINIIYNTCYSCFVFSYRVVKFILKGTKFKFLPLMPMYKFE